MYLRLKDIDFQLNQIRVWDGKGAKDRLTVLPQSLIEPLKIQIAKVENLHLQDLRDGYGSAYLPFALSKKFPNAVKETGWPFTP